MKIEDLKKLNQMVMEMTSVEKTQLMLNMMSKMDVEDLKSVNGGVVGEIRHRQLNRDLIAKSSLKAGSKVMWQSRRCGGTETGTIERLKERNALVVKSDGSRWNVPCGILTAA